MRVCIFVRTMYDWLHATDPVDGRGLKIICNIPSSAALISSRFLGYLYLIDYLSIISNYRLRKVLQASCIQRVYDGQSLYRVRSRLGHGSTLLRTPLLSNQILSSLLATDTNNLHNDGGHLICSFSRQALRYRIFGVCNVWDRKITRRAWLQMSLNV